MEACEEDFRASLHIFSPSQLAILSYDVVSCKNCVILESSCNSGFISLFGVFGFPLCGTTIHLGDPLEGSSFHPEVAEEDCRASIHILALGQVAVISYSTVSLKDYIILKSSCSSGFIALFGVFGFLVWGSSLNL